jgi:hypothetical protein
MKKVFLRLELSQNSNRTAGRCAHRIIVFQIAICRKLPFVNIFLKIIRCTFYKNHFEKKIAKQEREFKFCSFFRKKLLKIRKNISGFFKKNLEFCYCVSNLRAIEEILSTHVLRQYYYCRTLQSLVRNEKLQ